MCPITHIVQLEYICSTEWQFSLLITLVIIRHNTANNLKHIRARGSYSSTRLFKPFWSKCVFRRSISSFWIGCRTVKSIYRLQNYAFSTAQRNDLATLIMKLPGWPQQVSISWPKLPHKGVVKITWHISPVLMERFGCADFFFFKKYFSSAFPTAFPFFLKKIDNITQRGQGEK